MKILLAAILLASTAASAHPEAWQRKYLLASRNSGGTYSLPNAPVVTGTTITSSWANTTLADLATELTNSLDRSGRGAMTGPLRLNNGANVAIPDIAWGVETNSGWYRAGVGDFRFAVAGVDFLKITTNNLLFFPTGPAVLLNNIAVPGWAGIWVGANTTAPTTLNYTFLTSGGETLVNTPTGGDIALRVNNANVVLVTATGAQVTGTLGAGPTTIGTNGTSISASIRGTLVVSSGSIAAQTCSAQNVPVTGAVAGAECSVGYTTAANPVLQTTCSVTAANVCVLDTCNVSAAGTIVPANTLSCRVFNP